MSSREQLLRSALAELIDVDAHAVCVNTPFAEQGIDSLLGLRFVRRVQDLLGAEVELEWLFDHPSIRELSAFLDERFGALDAQPAGAE
jgi:aryl carrier-like protein